MKERNLSRFKQCPYFNVTLNERLDWKTVLTLIESIEFNLTGRSKFLCFVFTFNVHIDFKHFVYQRREQDKSTLGDGRSATFKFHNF